MAASDLSARPALTRQLSGAADVPGSFGGGLSAASPAGSSAFGVKEAAGSSETAGAAKSGGSFAGGSVKSPYAIRLGGITDEGVPGKVNYDAFFKADLGRGTVVIGVFDGHGRELGRKAGEAARDCIQKEFAKAESLKQLRADPEATLRAKFALAHEHIEAVFVRHYRDQGWHVVKDPTGGFLLRQRSAGPGAPAMCVHGGTTATLVAVLDGRLMVIANCGDSSAVMCGASPDTFPLQPIDTWPREEAVAGESGLEAMGLEAVLPDVGGVVGAAVGGAGAGGGEGSSASTSPSLDSSAVPDGCEACVAASPKLLAAGWEMSADHGPENPGEYERMRASHPSKADRAGLSPYLSFVYDTLTSAKTNCPDIFARDPVSRQLSVTNRGQYYKNVRNEWATLVATPPMARFQDALAFTRSLGDFHLQSYGVSHVPEVKWVRLANADAETGAVTPVHKSAFALATCSDGVWDNWKFEELSAWVLAPARFDGRDAQELSVELMDENKKLAHKHFGTSADNMTVTITMFLPVEASASAAGGAEGASAGGAGSGQAAMST